MAGPPGGDPGGRPERRRRGRARRRRRRRLRRAAGAGETLPGIVLGRELAHALRVCVGDQVNVVSPLGDIGPAGPQPKSRPFRVAGIFFSGMYEYDSKFAYIDLAEAQRFFGTGDSVTGLELKVDEHGRRPADHGPGAVRARRLALPHQGLGRAEPQPLLRAPHGEAGDGGDPGLHRAGRDASPSWPRSSCWCWRSGGDRRPQVDGRARPERDEDLRGRGAGHRRGGDRLRADPRRWAPACSSPRSGSRSTPRSTTSDNLPVLMDGVQFALVALAALVALLPRHHLPGHAGGPPPAGGRAPERVMAAPWLAHRAALQKAYLLGGRRIDVLRGLDLKIEAGRDGGPHRPLRRGQEHLPAPAGHARRPHRAAGSSSRACDVRRARARSELARFRNETIGFVFQFHHLLPEFTALENAMMPALIRRLARGGGAAAARRECWSWWGSDRLDHRPGELSGGEQQRVALARALVPAAAPAPGRRAHRQPRPDDRRRASTSCSSSSTAAAASPRWWSPTTSGSPARCPGACGSSAEGSREPFPVARENPVLRARLRPPGGTIPFELFGMPV